MSKDRNFHEVVDEIIHIIEFNTDKNTPNHWIIKLRELKSKHMFTPHEIKSSWVDLGNLLNFQLNATNRDLDEWEWDIFYLVQNIDRKDVKKHYGKLTNQTTTSKKDEEE